MRRSKSDPSKYARNYRVISQRRMTLSHEDSDEKKSKILLQNQTKENMHKLLDDAAIADENKRKKKKKKMRLHQKEEQELIENDNDNDNDEEELFPEGTIILPARKKKKKKDDENVELTAEEIRLAKLQHKNLKRKLQQLSSRSTAKERRKEAYESLAQNSMDSKQLSLLSSSSNLGKRESKKQIIQRIWKKQQAGIALTDEEKDLLLMTKEVDEEANAVAETTDLGNLSKNDNVDGESASKKKKKKASKSSKSSLKITTKRNDDAFNTDNICNSSYHGSDEERNDEDGSMDEELKTEAQKEDVNEKPECIHENQSVSNIKNDKNDTTPQTKPPSGLSFAEMMMSGLANLKTKAQEDQKEHERIEKIRIEKEEREAEKQISKQPKYSPSEPIKIQTLTNAILNKDDKKIPSNPCVQLKELPVITRPEDVTALRDSNALPIFSMEFEILDAVQSNVVTIVCGETGSGKSTQVPQFLYEAGYSSPTKDGKNLLIGMTQPRRVAAISTAKRISYEMSSGNGQIIRKNSLVSYQTRYETAGLGGKTHIKVMTDGILLQEIQSDLLLRKYSVIVLDEAHERNLNTDVLLGLISRSIMLRKQVAKEEGETLPELKLVIMSATLRVQDFTENEKLFGGDDGKYRPAVVTVPGRTFPVSIHHSKVTELDDYESEAMKKICKIHRKLPDGGILVFMTGKQEIDRMVKRLRKCLNSRIKNKITNSEQSNELIEKSNFSHDGPRDLDDDEIDGNMMDKSEHDDYDEMEKDNDIMGIINSSSEPLKSALVLPLHSLLSQAEQAKVFAPVPPDHRLIVITTNIAETSITIPNISYVVDTGRQKCLSHHSSTGMKSYDIMWISKASANQRAGRAGRTGPGHCYRLYSSSLFDRQMENFAIPEVLVRPLEDIVLTMKNMGIQNVLDFPFVTQPDKNQIIAALDLLLNIGCLESDESSDSADSAITSMGKAVSKLPLGVRYGKMLLVAAKCGILDYAIGLVAVLSENSPFNDKFSNGEKDKNEKDGDEDLDEVDRNNIEEQKRQKSKSKKWLHAGGDVLAAVHALGAYTYAGRGAGGVSETVACQAFCEENGLNFVVMQRIQKLRMQLAKMTQMRMKDMIDLNETALQSVAIKTGGIIYNMPPPNVLQETLLRQAIASGLVDNIARLSPHDSVVTTSSTYNSRLSYQSCKSTIREPLFINSTSTLYSRDFRRLPEWVCYDSIIRKPTKTGGNICTMLNVTPIDPSWLAFLSDKSNEMLSLGDVVNVPSPFYDKKKDAIMCYVKAKYGYQSWEIPPLAVVMKDKSKEASSLMLDDSYRWFARFLLEGKVVSEFASLPKFLNDSPIIITKRKPVAKCALLVSALSSADVDSFASLQRYWAEKDQRFLFRLLKPWVKQESIEEFKSLWMKVVKENVKDWKSEK